MVESSGGMGPPLDACPLLGLSGDSRTHYSFPHEAHRCHALERPAPIELSWQGSLCLTPTFLACPRYQAREPGRRASLAPSAVAGAPGGIPITELVEPARTAARRRRTGHPRGRVAALALAALLAVAAITLSPVRPGGRPASAPGVTPAAVSSPTGSPGAVAGATGTPEATGPGAASRPPPASDAPASSTRARTHVVEEGEWLSTIAERYGTTVEELLRLNNITDPDVIEVGQEIVLPAR